MSMLGGDKLETRSRGRGNGSAQACHVSLTSASRAKGPHARTGLIVGEVCDDTPTAAFNAIHSPPALPVSSWARLDRPSLYVISQPGSTSPFYTVLTLLTYISSLLSFAVYVLVRCPSCLKRTFSPTVIRPERAPSPKHYGTLWERVLLLIHLSACPLTPTRPCRYLLPGTRSYAHPRSIWRDAYNFVFPDTFWPEH